jgi:hypothetical protein
MGNWNPQVRPHYSLDFEDWRSQESDEAWVFDIPEVLTNGSNMDASWFISASEDMESQGSPSMADYCLRMAAQRGSALAMMILGQDRSAMEFDDEALRWFRRVSFLMADPRNEAWMTPEDRHQFASDALRFQQACVQNGADPDAESPDDIGLNSLGAQGLAPVYCLKCGTQKYPNVPADQCDDSVHLVRRNFG